MKCVKTINPTNMNSDAQILYFAVTCTYAILRKQHSVEYCKERGKLGGIPVPSWSNNAARSDWTRDATFSRCGFVGSDTQDLFLNSTKFSSQLTKFIPMCWGHQWRLLTMLRSDEGWVPVTNSPASLSEKWGQRDIDPTLFFIIGNTKTLFFCSIPFYIWASSLCLCGFFSPRKDMVYR